MYWATLHKNWSQEEISCSRSGFPGPWAIWPQPTFRSGSVQTPNGSAQAATLGHTLQRRGWNKLSCSCDLLVWDCPCLKLEDVKQGLNSPTPAPSKELYACSLPCLLLDSRKYTDKDWRASLLLKVMGAEGPTDLGTLQNLLWVIHALVLGQLKGGEGKLKEIKRNKQSQQS